MTAAAWSLVAAPALALGITAINALTWRRGRKGARFDGAVSVLVPARNEADRLPATLRAIARSTHPTSEILVYDDGSTDGTGAVLESLRAEIPTLRVLRGEGPPPGWVGKPHACHALAGVARGATLVFIDADVELEPEGLELLASVARRDRAALVTAMPRQRTGSLVEALVVPVLLLTYVSWLPLALVARIRDPRVVAANGQIVAVRREALEALGGFAAVRSEIVDDVALARRAKAAGLRVAFADGTRMASCRMYRSATAVWDGFSKNVHEGVGGNLALALVVVLYLGAFVAPWVALVMAAGGQDALVVPAVAAATANVAQRAIMVGRWRQPITSLLLHPASVLAAVVVALNSARWSARNEIRWAGRSYAARKARGGVA